ncbi:hypothetical protein BH10PSE1_BH10PSE1_13700 [soil metagenome]
MGGRGPPCRVQRDLLCGGMGKYDPLRDHLRRRREPKLELSFADVERRLGYMLPNSAASPDWWACVGEPGPREVQKIAWREAGYDATLLSGERVRFQRIVGEVGMDQAPKSKAI